MNNMDTQEKNKLIAEFMGFQVKPNVANWTEFDEVSLTTHWNNDKGTWAHVPKGSGEKWYRVFHRGQYYQLYTDFTFMKLDESKIEEGFTKDNSYYILKDALFHSSWDWLMPIVEKIRAVSSYDKGDRFGTNVDLKHYEVVISSGKYESTPIENSTTMYHRKTGHLNIGFDNLAICYSAVIEFIKWYNKNK